MVFLFVANGCLSLFKGIIRLPQNSVVPATVRFHCHIWDTGREASFSFSWEAQAADMALDLCKILPFAHIGNVCLVSEFITCEERQLPSVWFASRVSLRFMTAICVKIKIPSKL